MFTDVGWNNNTAAVPRSVRTAETESRRGRRARHRTFAARVFSARFVLIPAPPSAVFVRFYGADGTLLGVDAGPAGYIDLDADRTPVFGEDVEAHTEALLPPTPDRADRLRTLACVNVTNSSGDSEFCDDESENGVVVMGACDGSDPVGGIVAAGVANVRLTLGSSAQFTVPARELPAAFGGRRAIGAPCRVREAAALDAAGQEVARTFVGTAPGGQPCAGEEEGNDRFSGHFVPVSRRAPSQSVRPAANRCSLPNKARHCAWRLDLRFFTAQVPPTDLCRPRRRAEPRRRHRRRSTQTVRGQMRAESSPTT